MTNDELQRAADTEAVSTSATSPRLLSPEPDQ